MKIDHKKLVDILLSLHDSNNAVQKQLDIIFAGLDESPKKIISMIKREIASLKKSTKLVEYYESNSLADRLDGLRLRIANDLNDKSPKIAFEMIIEFLNLHKKTLDRVEDSNGTVGDVFILACKNLGNLLQNINHLTLIEIVDIVFLRFMNNDYYIYNDIIHNTKDALGNEGLNLLRKKLEEICNPKNIFEIKLGLKSIADCNNDVDSFINACSFIEKPGSDDCFDIAKRLIEHWRTKEALEWIDKINISKNHLWQQQKIKELKIQALELEGYYKQAQNERLSLFDKNLSPTLYNDILKTSEKPFKEIFKSDSLKKAFKFYEAQTALHFLIEIHEFNEAANFIRLRFNELNGEQYNTLRIGANLLQSIDPIAATLLYRKMINPILEETKYKYYRYAAKDLVMCSSLNAKITDWQEFQKHSDYFKDIEVKHKRKRRFWSEYNSALLKQEPKNSKI